MLFFNCYTLAEYCLGCCQAGDRHPERRATHIGEAGQVEELDGVGIAAMLAADP
jgi:hypothetical protein